MQGIDWNAVLAIITLAQWVVMIVVGIVGWVGRRKRATKAEIAQVKTDLGERMDKTERRLSDHAERLTRGEGRFQKIEESILALPTANAMHEMTLAMQRLSGRLDVSNERFDGFEQMYKTRFDAFEQMHNTLDRQVMLIDQWLRKNP